MTVFSALAKALRFFAVENNEGFLGGASDKEPVSQCRRHKDVGLIPGSGRSPGEGDGSPLQYSCLEHPMDRGSLWATVHSVAESDTTLRDMA